MGPQGGEKIEICVLLRSARGFCILSKMDKCLCSDAVANGVLLVLFVPFSTSFVAMATPAASEVEGRWQLTAPEGESYSMTSEDVAQIGDRPFQIDMGGHKIVTEFASNAGLIFVATGGVNSGDIEVRKGHCGFESTTGSGGTTAQSMTFAEGTYMCICVLPTPQARNCPRTTSNRRRGSRRPVGVLFAREGCPWSVPADSVWSFAR